MALTSMRRLIAPLVIGLVISILVNLFNPVNPVAIAKDESKLFSLFQPIKVAVNESFISPLVELFGDVSVGHKVFVASNTIVRAEPNTKICIGNETNLQDNILFLALNNSPSPNASCGKTSSSTGIRNSIAHQAIIKNSQIGNFTFVGFHAQLNNVVLEDGAFVLHGAFLENVRIKRDRIVPIGAVITTQAQADTLELKTKANSTFQDEVLEVNEEFAAQYPKLFKSKGFDSVTGANFAPTTSWNPKPVKPTLGTKVQLDEFVRLVGDVRLGNNSMVGQRTSIRADEGSPIEIGDGAVIEDRVTFHALKGTSIKIGSNLKTSDNIVFHGPLEVGNNLTIDDDAILFRSKVGNNVTIGKKAIVVGVTLADRTVVPPNTIVTTQKQADALMAK